MGEDSRNTYIDWASGDTRVAQVLSDAAFFREICTFETKLAQAAFKVGLVTEYQLTAALAAIDAYELDAAEIRDVAQSSAEGANPAIPIVKKLKLIAGESGSKAIHIGATSQDAIDTALVLCLTKAGRILEEQLGDVDTVLRRLVEQHLEDPMIGRTLGQQANPMTFGAVAAGWLEGLRDAVEEMLRALEKLPVQYGGATGTLAAVYPLGIALHDELARALGLVNRPLIWHTNRIPLTRLAAALAQVSGALRKIAGDVVFLAANEVAELSEKTPGGSSSMPHKQNPAAAIAADGYARRAPGLTATMLDALDSRLQRGVGSWHSEWITIRELMAVTAATAARIHTSLDGIRVDTQAMKTHLNETSSRGHATEIAGLVLEKDHYSEYLGKEKYD